MLDLYKNIKKRRQELGLNQTELAQKTGYADKSMIAKIEAGKVDLTQSKIIDFSKALEIPAIDLMGLDNSHEKEISAASIVRSQLVNNDHRLLELIEIYGKLDNESKDMLVALARKLI